MKQLKSSSNELRRLFQRTVTVREIAEPLASFDANQSPAIVRAFLEEANFDVVGLRQQGRVIGYLRREELVPNSQQCTITPFRVEEVLDGDEPVSQAIEILARHPQVFVRVLGQVGGIVTKGDLQKTPVRLWLFGLITLLEMQMLRLIHRRFPADEWTKLLSAGRLRIAKQTFARLEQRNEHTDLSSCLQLCDKADIVLKDTELAKLAKFSSRKEGERFFHALVSLRDALAHADDIIKGRWPDLAKMAEKCEKLLIEFEASTA